MKIKKINLLFSTAKLAKIGIIGGGTAGLDISSKLIKQFPAVEIRVFEPSPIHFYQPGFTLLAADQYSQKEIQKKISKSRDNLFHKNITVTPFAVQKVDAEKKKIFVQTGQSFDYDQLIITAGVQNNWNLIPGAIQALTDENCPVSSIYKLEYAYKTRKLAKQFKGGRAIFTEPQAPFKSLASPFNILILLSEKWKKNGIKSELNFIKSGQNLFPVEYHNKILEKVISTYNIKTDFNKRLVEIKKNQRIAIFKTNNLVVQQKFDFLHLVPPMNPPQFIKNSNLADEHGYCNVDKGLLRHKKYEDIWAIGDCANLPTSKTAAAIFTQSEGFIKNFVRIFKKDEQPNKLYDGYTCCPFFVGNQKAFHAEFKYNYHKDTTLLDGSNSMFYIMNKDFFPYAYWNFVPQGIWAGKNGLNSW